MHRAIPSQELVEDRPNHTQGPGRSTEQALSKRPVAVVEGDGHRNLATGLVARELDQGACQVEEVQGERPHPLECRLPHKAGADDGGELGGAAELPNVGDGGSSTEGRQDAPKGAKARYAVVAVDATVG